MGKIPVDRKILEAIAPEQPINQDEQGGCVWCDGPFKKRHGMYATADPKDHAEDCPWVLIRKLLDGQKGS